MSGALDWLDEAECPPFSDLFFGGPQERPEARRVREWKASRVCARCRVIAKCRVFARNEKHGFWAGESKDAPMDRPWWMRRTA